MPKGKSVTLHPVGEADLDQFYAFHIDIRTTFFARQWHSYNASSRHLAEKCGFQYERITRGARYNQGKTSRCSDLRHPA